MTGISGRVKNLTESGGIVDISVDAVIGCCAERYLQPVRIKEASRSREQIHKVSKSDQTPMKFHRYLFNMDLIVFIVFILLLLIYTILVLYRLCLKAHCLAA
jgi:hypothetical protein